MMSRTVRIQIAAFITVTLLAVFYGATSLLPLGELVRPPYKVEAEFAKPGGIYPRADVELLGTRVGRVDDIKPGPDGTTIVVLAIDHDVDIPADVTAIIGSKSAIGEGFVELEPRSDSDEKLGDGDVIPLQQTVSPPDVASLLGHLDELAASIPLDDLATLLKEGSAAVVDVAPKLRRLIRDSRVVAESAVASVDSLTALIRDARTVLDTQVAISGATQQSIVELAGLTDTLRELDPTFDELFANGLRAGSEVTSLLRANQSALPVLLNNLISVTTIASDRVDGLRKTIVVFPWALEMGASGARYCDVYDLESGKPVENTCHYDENGDPIFSAHLAAQLPEDPQNPAYYPCAKGYEATVRYTPDGIPIQGGAKQKRDSEPNLLAHCAALPTDPATPNVRGAQNSHPFSTANRAAPFGLAMYNPNNGMLATPDGTAYRLIGKTAPFPPDGADGLEWLLGGWMPEGDR